MDGWVGSRPFHSAPSLPSGVEHKKQPDESEGSRCGVCFFCLTVTVCTTGTYQRKVTCPGWWQGTIPYLKQVRGNEVMHFVLNCMYLKVLCTLYIFVSLLSLGVVDRLIGRSTLPAGGKWKVRR